MSHGQRALARLGLCALAVLAAACGGGSSARQSAREQATSLTCQRFDMCMLIGAGKNYASGEACEIDWRSYWEKAWPAADCDDKINSTEFETCLAAIRATSCTNIFDLAATLGKCGKENVCRPVGGTPDAGGN